MQRPLSYPDFVAKTGQVNTPPGSYQTVKEWIRESFMHETSLLLDIGCSTGFIPIEVTRYCGARIVGIDLNEHSLRSARYNTDPAVTTRCLFARCSALHLPFRDVFSHVVTGGHLPFIPGDQRPQHVLEAVRVIRPWGYLLTALYFYHTRPPRKLIERLNQHLGTHLSGDCDESYWVSLLEVANLDVEYHAVYEFVLPDKGRVENYVQQFYPADQPLWRERLQLFAENGQYMRYFVRVSRKRPTDGDSLRQIPRGGIYHGFRRIEEARL